MNGENWGTKFVRKEEKNDKVEINRLGSTNYREGDCMGQKRKNICLYVVCIVLKYGIVVLKSSLRKRKFSMKKIFSSKC